VVDVDGQIAEHLQAPVVGEALDPGPLKVHEEEHHLPHRDAVRQRLAGLADRVHLTGAQRDGPLPPRGLIVLPLQGEEVRGVREPGLLRAEARELFAPGVGRARQERLGRGKELRELRRGQLGERHGVVNDVAVQLRVRQEPMRRQVREVDQPGVARECRVAEVGRVVLPVQREREDLPDARTGQGEPVDEPQGLLAQGADVVTPEEA